MRETHLTKGFSSTLLLLHGKGLSLVMELNVEPLGRDLVLGIRGTDTFVAGELIFMGRLWC